MTQNYALVIQINANVKIVNRWKHKLKVCAGMESNETSDDIFSR